MGTVSNGGFGQLWSALVSFGRCARVVRQGTRAVQALYAEYAVRARQTRACAKLWESARRDPRVMTEILAAVSHAELVDN